MIVSCKIIFKNILISDTDLSSNDFINIFRTSLKYILISTCSNNVLFSMRKTCLCNLYIKNVGILNKENVKYCNILENYLLQR